MDDHKYLEILKTNGVVKVLGKNKRELFSIPNEEIESVKILTENKTTINNHPYVKEENNIEIVNRHLAGAKGILTEKNSHKSTIVVTIHLIEKSISVEVDNSDIEPC